MKRTGTGLAHNKASAHVPDAAPARQEHSAIAMSVRHIGSIWVSRESLVNDHAREHTLCHQHAPSFWLRPLDDQEHDPCLTAYGSTASYADTGAEHCIKIV